MKDEHVRLCGGNRPPLTVPQVPSRVNKERTSDEALKAVARKRRLRYRSLLEK